jgi:5-methyltetrahydropteroyltriglutamate--homocysteine methyltransferase
MPVDILSHEFKATPKLFQSFNDFNITKKICLGSVQSDNIRIEPTDEIVDHIQKAINIFDGKIVQIAPDCGLRNLPRDIAFKKLKNLVKARDKVYG